MRKAYRVTKNPRAKSIEYSQCLTALKFLIRQRHVRFRTYWPNPFMLRLNFARRECSICRTRSFSSSLSSSLQSEIETPWGKTAKYLSPNTDEMLLFRVRVVVAGCICSSYSFGKIGAVAVSDLSMAKSFSSGTLDISASAVPAGRRERS